MPGFIAKKLCPDLVIVPTNFDKYRAVSKEVRGDGKLANKDCMHAEAYNKTNSTQPFYGFLLN